MEAVVFFIAAAIILVGGLGVIVLRNPVHAALSLVMTLFGVAVQFINLEAYFLAAVQVIVYAGAIVVLFLFVIMLVGVDKAEDIRTEPIIGQRQFALLAGAALLALAAVVGVAAAGDVTGQPQNPDLAISRAIENADGTTTPPETGNVQQLAEALFTDYVFAFEITALLLTIAVVGAVVLARRPKGALEPLPEVEPSWALRSPSAPDIEDELAVVDAEAAGEADAVIDGLAEDPDPQLAAEVSSRAEGSDEAEGDDA